MGKNPGLGIGLSVLGSLCTALGYTFQKLAHRRADASAEAAAREVARNAGPGTDLAEGGPSSLASLPKPLPKGTPYYRFWQFPAGLAMLILGSIVGVITFGLAGQAELAPMSAVTLVWNELLAWRVSRPVVELGRKSCTTDDDGSHLRSATHSTPACSLALLPSAGAARALHAHRRHLRCPHGGRHHTGPDLRRLHRHRL